MHTVHSRTYLVSAHKRSEVHCKCATTVKSNRCFDGFTVQHLHLWWCWAMLTVLL